MKSLLTGITYAIVKPANAPPKRTNIRAVPRYIHRLRSSGSWGAGASSATCRSLFNGAALVDENWLKLRNNVFANPTTAVRAEAYPLKLRGLAVVVGVLEVIVIAFPSGEDVYRVLAVLMAILLVGSML